MDPDSEHLGAAARTAQLRAAGLAPVLEVEPLVFNRNNSATGIVERLALADGTDVVRKVLLAHAPVSVPHWAAGATPDHWNYWRREAEAYLASTRAEVRSILPGRGVTAPDLLGHVSPTDGVEVLFLEHLEGRSGPQLREEDLVSLARGLGCWQGAETDPDHLPPASVQDWWSRDWTFDYAASRPTGECGYEDDEAWAQPLVVEGFGGSLDRIRDGFARLYAEIDRWRSVAVDLPQAPAHLDCWANNAVIAEGRLPVLFDWSFCGLAPLGVDAGNLVPDGLLDHYGDPGSYARLNRLVADAYTSGLADAGWNGCEDHVRLAMGTMPVKFAWLPALMVANADWAGPTGYGGQKGLEHLEVFRRRAVVFEAMLDQVEQARSLARALGFAI